MADYIVKDTELTSVANAIRTAGGTNSLLNFPNGFVSAVNNISGGGGSSDFSTATVTIVNNAPGSVAFSLSLAIAVTAEGMSATLGSVSSEMLGSGMTFNTVLYNGAAFMGLMSSAEYDFTIEASGDAQITGYNCMITGDCTITIS